MLVYSRHFFLSKIHYYYSPNKGLYVHTYCFKNSQKRNQDNNHTKSSLSRVEFDNHKRFKILKTLLFLEPRLFLVSGFLHKQPDFSNKKTVCQSQPKFRKQPQFFGQKGAVTLLYGIDTLLKFGSLVLCMEHLESIKCLKR